MEYLINPSSSWRIDTNPQVCLKWVRLSLFSLSDNEGEMVWVDHILEVSMICSQVRYDALPNVAATGHFRVIMSRMTFSA